MPSRTRYYFTIGNKPCFTRKQILAAVQNYLGKTARDMLQTHSSMRFVDALREIATAYLGKSGFILFVVREPRSARGGNSTYVKVTSEMYGVPWLPKNVHAPSFIVGTDWQAPTASVVSDPLSSALYTQAAQPTPPQSSQPGAIGQTIGGLGGFSSNIVNWNSSNS